MRASQFCVSDPTSPISATSRQVVNIEIVNDVFGGPLSLPIAKEWFETNPRNSQQQQQQQQGSRHLERIVQSSYYQ
ncbi:hypothetical protein M0802_010680 [Mischocyttarus mexicanus]|nr:hypothetical protein M0802_010680 [Mischocyttarus mexicanus]